MIYSNRLIAGANRCTGFLGHRGTMEMKNFHYFRAFQIFWYHLLYQSTLKNSDTKTYDQLNFSRRLQINNNETLLQIVLTVSPTSPRIDTICMNVNIASSNEALSLISLVYRTLNPLYSALKRSQTLLMNTSN